MPASEAAGLCGPAVTDWDLAGAKIPVIQLTGWSKPQGSKPSTVDHSALIFADYAMRASGGALAGLNAAGDLRDVLLAWASADALTRYAADDWRGWNNAFFAGNTAFMTAVVSYSLVREDAVFSAEQQNKIEAWMSRVVTRLWVGPTGLASQSNHRILHDAAHMAYGALVGNPVEFGAGAQGYARALRTARRDGALMFEIIRGARALHYQSMAIGLLVTLAEMGAVQGYDLYGFQSEAGVDLHAALGFLLRGIEDPSIVLPDAEENYVAPPGSDPKHQDLSFLKASEMAWVELYVRRFPERDEAKSLGKLISSGRLRQPMITEYEGANTSCLFAKMLATQ
jgi:hypothetical protein